MYSPHAIRTHGTLQCRMEVDYEAALPCLQLAALREILQACIRNTLLRQAISDFFTFQVFEDTLIFRLCHITLSARSR
jgi:hypothetical protein